ncbi:MAG: GNAT family N-acetyltransferase [Pelobium sp.]
MELNRFSEIETERLLLRKPKHEDWEMISYLRSDKQVNKFVNRASAETKLKALGFIARITKGIEKEEILYWIITEKSNDEMMGSICLWHFSEDFKTAEVGYDLNPKFQGKGIMDESLKSIIEFGFKSLNLDSIEAYTHGENNLSKNLLERNSFKIIKGKKDEDNKNNIVYELEKLTTIK